MEKRTTFYMRLVAAIGRIPTMRRTGILWSSSNESPRSRFWSTHLLIPHLLFLLCCTPTVAGSLFHLMLVPGALRARERKRHAMDKIQQAL